MQAKEQKIHPLTFVGDLTIAALVPKISFARTSSDAPSQTRIGIAQRKKFAIEIRSAQKAKPRLWSRVLPRIASVNELINPTRYMSPKIALNPDRPRHSPIVCSIADPPQIKTSSPIAINKAI